MTSRAYRHYFYVENRPEKEKKCGFNNGMKDLSLLRGKHCRLYFKSSHANVGFFLAW